MNKWTEERIRERCIEYCGRCFVSFDVPVVINKRIKRTLGRCFIKRTGLAARPYKIEIAQFLLDNATDKSIEAVIAHECAHYIAAVMAPSSQGHDEIFKSICKRIGTTNDGANYSDIEWAITPDKMYKYSFYCKKCGEFICGRSRKCHSVTHPEFYMSPCCDAEIEVKQNW